MNPDSICVLYLDGVGVSGILAVTDETSTLWRYIPKEGVCSLNLRLRVETSWLF